MSPSDVHQPSSFSVLICHQLKREMDGASQGLLQKIFRSIFPAYYTTTPKSLDVGGCVTLLSEKFSLFFLIFFFLDGWMEEIRPLCKFHQHDDDDDDDALLLHHVFLPLSTSFTTLILWREILKNFEKNCSPGFVFVGEHDDASSAGFLRETLDDSIVIGVFCPSQNLLRNGDTNSGGFGQRHERCDPLVVQTQNIK